MKIRAVDFVFTPVSDFKRSLAFYKKTLGMKLLSEWQGKWAEFDLGNVALGIGVRGPVKRGGTGIALAVPDVAKAVAELKKKGVKILTEPQEHSICFMATIVDPDGNEIMLHARKDGTAG